MKTPWHGGPIQKSNSPGTFFSTKGPDGFIDLTMKFDAREVVQAIGQVADGDIMVMELKGNLLEEFGGTPIKGEDVVVILKKKKK
jgi:hypothetical protein